MGGKGIHFNTFNLLPFAASQVPSFGFPVLPLVLRALLQALLQPNNNKIIILNFTV